MLPLTPPKIVDNNMMRAKYETSIVSPGEAKLSNFLYLSEIRKYAYARSSIDDADRISLGVYSELSMTVTSPDFPLHVRWPKQAFMRQLCIHAHSDHWGKVAAYDVHRSLPQHHRSIAVNAKLSIDEANMHTPQSSHADEQRKQVGIAKDIHNRFPRHRRSSKCRDQEGPRRGGYT